MDTAVYGDHPCAHLHAGSDVLADVRGLCYEALGSAPSVSRSLWSNPQGALPMGQGPRCPRGSRLPKELWAEPGFAHGDTRCLRVWTHSHTYTRAHTHTHTQHDPGTSITKEVTGSETFSPSIPGAPGNPSSPWKGAENKQGQDGVPPPWKGVCGWAAPPMASRSSLSPCS